MKRVVGIVAGVLLVVAFTATRGDDDPYSVKLRLSNAGGLRDGSPVVVGGVAIGTVRLQAHRRYVDARLEIEHRYAPLGRDTRAAIVAQNVLGQKQLRLTPGDTADPAPDGSTLPAPNITETTDLDQLLSTLDPDTRTRLAIMLNETGVAFAGRALDLRRFLVDFAPALSHGGQILAQLNADNRALRTLLATSDRYVGALAGERRRLSRMLDLVGRTSETVAARRVALRQTLAQAPGALAETRAFLAELRHATRPLGVTARMLAASAPSLQATLERIEPFRRAAQPTLASATAVAPALTRLADRGTPLLRRTLPLLSSLTALSQNEVPPVGTALDRSMDNLLGLMDNWSRAIQFRDRLSHVFRGEATSSPDYYQSILRRLGVVPTRQRRPGSRRPAPSRPAAERPRPTADSAPRLPLPPAAQTLQKLIDALSPPDALKALEPPKTGSGDASPLLDYLLGKR